MGANICIRTCACVHMWFEQERARATTRAQEFEGVRVKEATASMTAAATARERVWATRGHEKAREGEEGGKKVTATVREVAQEVGVRGQGQVAESTHDGQRAWWLPNTF
jgi:hypothetical protein